MNNLRLVKSASDQLPPADRIMQRIANWKVESAHDYTRDRIQELLDKGVSEEDTYRFFQGLYSTFKTNVIATLK